MLRLLKIEWLKYKNYPTFWILLVLIAISIPAAIYMGYNGTDNAFPKNSKSMQEMVIGKPFSFPLIWHTGSWIAGIVLFIPSLLMITITTNEFTYKTHRQNIIDGLTRTQFISVKIVEVFILAVITTLLAGLGILIVGNLATDPGSNVSIFKDAHQLLYFFIEAASYLMLAFLLSILIKRAGLVLGIFFLYSLIAEQVAYLFLKFHTTSDPGRFFPLQTTDNLILNPFQQRFMKPEELRSWESMVPVHITLAGLYFLTYVFISVYNFKTKDL